VKESEVEVPERASPLRGFVEVEPPRSWVRSLFFFVTLTAEQPSTEHKRNEKTKNNQGSAR
jgi:hypothetical protein